MVGRLEKIWLKKNGRERFDITAYLLQELLDVLLYQFEAKPDVPWIRFETKIGRDIVSSSSGFGSTRLRKGRS